MNTRKWVKDLIDLIEYNKEYIDHCWATQERASFFFGKNSGYRKKVYFVSDKLGIKIQTDSILGVTYMTIDKRREEISGHEYDIIYDKILEWSEDESAICFIINNKLKKFRIKK